MKHTVARVLCAGAIVPAKTAHWYVVCEQGTVLAGMARLADAKAFGKGRGWEMLAWARLG